MSSDLNSQLFSFLELAGEIVHFHPKATVTLVHAGPKLLNSTYPDKFRDALAAKCEAKGMNLALGERVLNLPPQGLFSDAGLQVQMESGSSLEADLVVSSFICIL